MTGTDTTCPEMDCLAVGLIGTTDSPGFTPGSGTPDGAWTGLSNLSTGGAATDRSLHTEWDSTRSDGDFNGNGTLGSSQNWVANLVIYSFDFDIPAQVSDLRAQRLGSSVILEWDTLSEIEHAGFRVLRDGPMGSEVNLTPQLIAPAGAGGELDGTHYRFVDRFAPLGATRYWLEDVDIQGGTTRHGSVDVPAAAWRPIELPQPLPPAGGNTN